MRKFFNFTLYLYNHRIVRYLFSGGMAAITNIAILFALVHFFHVWYLLAAVASYIFAISVSFMMQKFFTFSDYTKRKIKQQTLFYFLIQLFNLGLNTLLMYISVDILKIYYIVAQVLIIGIIAIYSFFAYKHLVFTPDVVNDEKQQ